MAAIPEVRVPVKITVTTDGGPWAEHDMPCTVCRTRVAVLDLSCGLMQPCWQCQEDGWVVTWTRVPWLRRHLTERARRILRG